MGGKNKISQNHKMAGKKRLVLVCAVILLLIFAGAGATKLATSNNNKTSKAWELIKQRRAQNNLLNDGLKSSKFHKANEKASTSSRSPASTTIIFNSAKETGHLKKPGFFDKITDAIKDIFGDSSDKRADDPMDTVAKERDFPEKSGDEKSGDKEEPSLFDEIADALGDMFGDGADESGGDSSDVVAEEEEGRGKAKEIADGENEPSGEEASGEEERAPGGEGEAEGDAEYAQDEGAPRSFGDEDQSFPDDAIADGSDEGSYDEGDYSEDPYEDPFEETANTDSQPEAKSSTASVNSDNQVLVTQTAVTTPNCSVDKSPGIYSSTIDVAISCDQASDIFYCFQKDGCCSPYSQGTLYSEPITVGAVDGEYCISYFASPITTFTGGSYDTDMAELDYRIDSTTPSLLVDTPVIQLQTTHPAITSYVASNDYGKPYNYLHKINLNNHDPTSAEMNWSCEETLFDHQYLNNSPSYIILDSYDVSNVSTLNEVNVDIYVSDLLYGKNHISTILEDSARQRYACQSTKVVLEDFQLFCFSGAKGPPAYPGSKSFEGGFVSYGHFEEAPSDLARSGHGKNTVSNISLTTSFQNMRHE